MDLIFTYFNREKENVNQFQSQDDISPIVGLFLYESPLVHEQPIKNTAFKTLEGYYNKAVNELEKHVGSEKTNQIQIAIAGIISLVVYFIIVHMIKRISR